MNVHTVFRAGLCCIIVAALFVPFAGALSDNSGRLNTQTTYRSQDSPDIIAALKDHASFLAESQQARMDGVIRYVSCIGNMTGVSDLQWIEEDYLTSAASIPLMYSSDDINDARKEMQDQSVRFSDETGIQLAMLGGNFDSMKSYVNDSMLMLEATLSDKNSTPWLTSARARYKVFLNSSEERNATLLQLNAQGVDTSKAREISRSIDAEKIALQEVLARRSGENIQSVNSRIRMLNQDFRNTVRQYRTDLDIRTRTAAIFAMK